MTPLKTNSGDLIRRHTLKVRLSTGQLTTITEIRLFQGQLVVVHPEWVTPLSKVTIPREYQKEWHKVMKEHFNG